jgi:Flp pilus assembly protein TadG
MRLPPPNNDVNFVRHNSGNVGLMFALFLLVLCGAAGAAVDIGQARRARTYLQADLDAVTLTLAASAKTATPEQGAALFTSNATRGDYFGPPPTFTIALDGSVQATANMSIKTMLLPLFGFDTLPVVVNSRATATYDSTAVVRFDLQNIQGWFAKDLYAVKKDDLGNVVEETKIVSYDYDHATDTRTIDPPLATVNSDFKLIAGSTFALKLRVWPAYPMSGTSRETVPYVDYFSDDPNAHIHRDGTCGPGEAYNWEDAPNNVDPTQQDFLDVVFTLFCKQMPGQPHHVRLSQ